jgi:hypothetical protein
VVDHDPWTGDSPVYLLLRSLEPNEGGAYGHLVLDVDLPGWMSLYADWTARSAEWYLCEKETDKILIAMVAHRGSSPFYSKRHVGQVRISGDRHRSIVAYGIGSGLSQAWVLPGGVACGSDVDEVAIAVLETMEWEAAEAAVDADV